MRQDRYMVQHQEFLLSRLTAEVMNRGMVRPDKWVNPLDLMPSRMKARTRTPRLNRKQAAKEVAGVMAMFLPKR